MEKRNTKNNKAIGAQLNKYSHFRSQLNYTTIVAGVKYK